MWIKFFVLLIPFTLFIFFFAPTMKWKVLYTICGAIGIGLALNGKAMRARN